MQTCSDFQMIFEICIEDGLTSQKSHIFAKSLTEFCRNCRESQIIARNVRSALEKAFKFYQILFSFPFFFFSYFRFCCAKFPSFIFFCSSPTFSLAIRYQIIAGRRCIFQNVSKNIEKLRNLGQAGRVGRLTPPPVRLSRP